MSENNHSLSRRRFIKTAAASALAAPFIIRCSSGGKTSKDNILQHACIGVGGMGWSDLQKFREHPNVKIVAICDVDAGNLKKALPIQYLMSIITHADQMNWSGCFDTD